MYILGVNSVFHESSACLLKNGQVIASAEEERFNRMKHGKSVYLFGEHDELPWQSIQYCLDFADIEPKQIEHICYSFNPQITNLFIANVNTNAYADRRDVFAKIPAHFKSMRFQGAFHWVNHHDAHAASSFYVSPFGEAAILVVDGIGESSSTTFFAAENNTIKTLQEILYPNSLGTLWALFSIFLGCDVYDAGKVMALAAYGDPNRYTKHFRQLVQLTPNGTFEMDNTVLHFEKISYHSSTADLQNLEKLFSFKKRGQGQLVTPEHADCAASLQAITNEIMLHMTTYLHELVPSKNLCLAGGVALNCVSNTAAFENGPFDHLFVQPAAHDGGTALGSACYVWNHLLGNKARQQIHHAYLGPSFTDTEVEQFLKMYQFKYTRMTHIEKEVARLISENNVIGFFQGRMELGPRSLGNRSLLADPRHPDMRNIVNQKIKHREDFRPLAPSVLYEVAHEWFVIKKDTPAAEYMLMAYPVRSAVKEKIPSVIHCDGTSRIQIVKRESNAIYHSLISEFFRITGIPMVLNTSFNDQEPIVCTPEDAIRTFLATDMDYLAIGAFLVSKADNRRRATGKYAMRAPAGLVRA